MSYLACLAGYWEAYMTPFLMPLTQVALAGSCYTTVALTVERYISGRPNCQSALLFAPVKWINLRLVKS